MKKKRKTMPALVLSSAEHLLVSLHQVGTQTLDAEIRGTSFSLLRWYQRNGKLTEPQWGLVKDLVTSHARMGFLRKAQPEKPKLRTKHSYALYAVRIGDVLKIGYSSNVDGRVSSYRTGTHDVELLATLPLGQCSRLHAKNQEKRLHKRIRALRVEREIFRLEAIEGFRAFDPAVELTPAKRLPRRFEQLPDEVTA